jgi:TolA-binding protein
MKRATIYVVYVLASLISGVTGCQSQGTAQSDATRFANSSVRASLSFAPNDRHIARSMFWQQVAVLSEDERLATTASLVMMLSSEDMKIRLESADMLTAATSFWATKNLANDSTSVYQLMLGTQDITLKNAMDRALANARGLYRDGISDYNSDDLTQVLRAGDKLKAMANIFPKSRYSENASFYVGQYFTKLYLMKDPRGRSLIDNSNAALGTYIAKAENGEFAKTEFLAAGYFYRALNELILGNLKDAQSWLTRGMQRFSDNDRVYVYQLFYTPNTIKTTADKFFPAKSIFANTLAYLQLNPNTGPGQQQALLAAINPSTF